MSPLPKNLSIFSIVALGALLSCCKSKATGGSRATAKTSSPGCVVKLVAESDYTCALLRDGRVECWGKNVPTLKARSQPEPVTIRALPGPVADLFAGWGLCVSTADTALWCAAFNNYRGQLSLPPSANSPPGVKQHQFRGVRSLTWEGGCALAQDGLTCWNMRGFHDPIGVPGLVTGLPSPPKIVTGGEAFACLLLENGQVFCRGSNERGELGILDGDTEEARTKLRLFGLKSFTQVHGVGDDVVQIASSSTNTCALKRDGSVWCWGENERGQIGNGGVSVCQKGPVPRACVPEEGLVPSQVVGLPKDLTALALGENTSCAYNTRGSVWCWGSTPLPTPKPIRLQLPEPITALGVGAGLCVALQSGGVTCHDFSRSLADWSAARDMNIDCQLR